MLGIKDLIIDILSMRGGFTSLPIFHGIQDIKSYDKGINIILIPGLASNWWDMYPHYKFFSDKGYSVHYLKELKQNFGSVSDSSKILMEYINSKKLNNVILVAHSKGGLVGKYAMSRLDETKKIRKMISIASPYNGVKIAKFLPFSIYRELSPKSEFIKSIIGDKRVNSLIVSIAAEDDNYIGEPACCFLEGAENIVLPIKGHHKVLYDIRTLNLILEKISQR